MADEFSEHRVERRALAVDPTACAVIVVDMLNDFLEEGGTMVLASGRALYDPLRRLLAAARAYGMPVVWVCDEHPQFDREFEKRTVHCLAGTWGAQVVDALDPRDDEYRVAKRRYSGFYETDLDLRLRELRIQQVVVTGVVTNICVRSTVHDAFFRGYDVIVPSDCVGATSEREQASTLWDIETHFGTVCELEQLLEAMSGAPAPLS